MNCEDLKAKIERIAAELEDLAWELNYSLIEFYAEELMALAATIKPKKDSVDSGEDS